MDATEGANCLQDIAGWRKNKRKNRTARLGDVVMEVMENRISPRQEKFGQLIKTWSDLLPEGLAEHCKIDGVSSGQLKILVDSPAFVHELRLCGSQLLEQLQQRCPRARIKNIKFTIGKLP